MSKIQRNEGLGMLDHAADDLIAEALRSVEKYKRRKAEEHDAETDETTEESIVVPEELADSAGLESPFELTVGEMTRSEPDAPQPRAMEAREARMREAERQLLEKLKTRTADLTREIQALEQALNDKTTEAQKNLEKAVWLTAELENTKKRHAREKAEIERYGAEKFLREVLPVLDNLERALLHARESLEPQVLSEGVHLTVTQFTNCLKRLGVTRIDLSPGMVFDPAVHEAMMQEESAVHPPNAVVREMQAGYMLQDRLLRASLVTVARPPSKASPVVIVEDEPRAADLEADSRLEPSADAGASDDTDRAGTDSNS